MLVEWWKAGVCYSNAMNDCPFCLENDLLQADKVHESSLWYFVDMFNKEATNSGLAITKRHIETPFEINSEEWAQLHDLLPTYKEHIDAREAPQGYNLGWNVFSAGGQTVGHAHLHIVGRYDDEQQAGRGIRYHFKPDKNPRLTDK
jgi:histidine triad (HIT) family protein